MPDILKNKNMEVRIDLPLEHYNLPRFDWTGKIVEVRFHNQCVTSIERADLSQNNEIGRGFYNEFGIDTPLGFEETKVGEWFHKIGIGLLKKEEGAYLFSNAYEIEPAAFEVEADANRVRIICMSKLINGYGYLLEKEIRLIDSGFIVNYRLKNTGSKRIITDEYDHNFISINNEYIGEDYVLKFPFELKPSLFEETVNPGHRVNLKAQEIRFNSAPEEPFFFSNLTGGKMVDASWELVNLKSKLGIRETGSFKTNKINLWGWQRACCPELFIAIDVVPGGSKEWSRRYEVFEWD